MSVMSFWAKKGRPVFDLIFLDPPYVEEGPDFFSKPDHNMLSYYAYRLLKSGGVVYLCGMQPQLARDWKYWDRLFDLVFELAVVKDSGTMLASHKVPVRRHENIWCLKRKADALSELKVDMRRVAKVIGEEEVRGRAMRVRDAPRGTYKLYEGYPTSVIEVKKIDRHDVEYLGHPAQKPIRLMRFILKVSCEENDWVLDPFAGTGTTLAAAAELGLNCIGIEINAKYVRVSRERIRGGLVQYL